MSTLNQAEERLESWPWRMGHSLWTLWAILGLGLFTWVGFAYIGVRARSLWWLLLATLWLPALVVPVALTPPDGTADDAPSWVIPSVVGAWLIGIVVTASSLPSWWRWRANKGDGLFDRIASTFAGDTSGESSSPEDGEVYARAQMEATQGRASAPAPSSAAPNSTEPSAPPASGSIPHPPTPPADVAPPPHHTDTEPRTDLANAETFSEPESAAALSRPADSQPFAGSRDASSSPTTSRQITHLLALGYQIPGLGVVDGEPEDAYGSFGTVYRVRRDFDGKHVAAKVFRVPRGLHGGEAADRALRDEMAALESLHHRNVVRVMNPVRLRDQGAWVLVSEWVEGTTLEPATLGIEPMAIEQVFDVGDQFLEALCHLEDQRVVHRDIKPTNVMLDVSGTLKLIDFNLTRISGRQTAVAGTTPYVPPDYLIDGTAVDSLVDRYATGVVLYALLTHKHPYIEYEQAGLPILPTSEPAAPHAFRPDLSPALAAFLFKAVQPVQSARFSSAVEMRAAWLNATTGSTMTPDEGARQPLGDSGDSRCAPP